MKTRISVAIFIILVVFTAGIRADVTISPSAITIPAGRQSSCLLTYRLSDPYGATTAASTQGVFRYLGLDVYVTLGTVNTTVSASMRGYPTSTGTATESLVIPISVIKKAEEHGITRFQYSRTFGGMIGQGVLNISLTSPSASELHITNIHLYFENQRAEITVKRKEPGLKTFADINFTGKGLFKGYWEVDGRLISYVNKNLTYGKSLTVATPDMPSLPTFSEGTHVVKFIIQNPVMGIEFPKALYYVTPGETTETTMISILNPFNLAVLERKDPLFQWQAGKPLAVYLLEFMEAENGEPVFAAYATESRYVIPNAALKNHLQSPQPYYWRVTGFDKENNIAGESEVRQVRFKTE